MEWGKYDKAFLDYVYKTAEIYIKNHPLNSRRFNIVNKHYNWFIWLVILNAPVKKLKRCFGMHIPDMIKDKSRMKELLQNALDNKNKNQCPSIIQNLK